MIYDNVCYHKSLNKLPGRGLWKNRTNCAAGHSFWSLQKGKLYRM